MKKISAEIVADSINQQGDRITTYLLTFPRFILAELNTHRVFSKNSASSRAIPFEKMIKMVQEDPFIPIAWQKDHKGMQGTEYFNTHYSQTNDYNQDIHYGFWMDARDEAIRMATCLHDEGLTKQLCNRLLEPFMWHTVLLTGTEFENFFKLRCPRYEFLYNDDTPPKYFRSKKELSEWYKDEFSTEKNPYNSDLEWLQINKSQAEIHIQALAEAMWNAMNESTPKELEAGEWHIPFGDRVDKEKVKFLHYGTIGAMTNTEALYESTEIKISTARCARLSYMTFDGEIDYEKDLKLHDTLLESRHMSPFEHCARAMGRDYDTFIKGELTLEKITQNFQHYKLDREDRRNIGWCNNFKGFLSYRYLIENDYENNNKFY